MVRLHDIRTRLIGCIVLLLLSCTQTEASKIPNIQFLQGRPLPTAPISTAKQYRFTEDMFAMRNRIFWQALSSFKDRPDIHYLEVGVYEGRALLWVLEHIFTHPTSTLTGIDLFASGDGEFKPKEVYANPKDFKQRYFQNINSSGQKQRITTHVGYSQDILKTLQHNSYDIIYIDGCHTLTCARADSLLAWSLLKKDGLLMIDDYSERDFPDVHTAAQELFQKHQHSMKVLHTGWVLVLQKTQ